jgi:hypothetical protein
MTQSQYQSPIFKPAKSPALSDPCAPDTPLNEEARPPEVALTRASVKALLVEMAEIATARKPVKLMLTISRDADGKKIRTQKSIEIFTRDRPATAGLLRLLGQELDMFKGESGRLPGAIKLGTKEQARRLFEKYCRSELSEEKAPTEQTEAKP